LEVAAMDERRRFNRTERAALYLAADGKCSDCGTELAAGWHADHVHPWSKSGPTDVINGQALCPRCNLKKGIQVMTDRDWQIEARRKYQVLNKRVFTLNASVGAGKTRWAASLAQELGRNVLVFSPLTSINRAWQTTLVAYGIQTKNGYEPHQLEKGYRGFIVTYSSLPTNYTNYRALVSRGNWLVIFDEVHHLGDGKAHGEAARQAFDGLPDLRILCLTGTPWRTSGDRMPIVSYGEDDCTACDYEYPYKSAFRDRVVRGIEFPAVDGDARIATPDGYKTLRIQDAKDDQVPEVVRSAIDGRSGWLKHVLRLAEQKRREHTRIVPNAAGLILVSEQSHATVVQKLMLTELGIRAVKIVSDDADADTRLTNFSEGTEPWVVAVRKVSEGVDIPRLTVGVYATNCKTRLFFTQAFGRLVRRLIDKNTQEYLDDGITACMFIPAATPHVKFAKEIADDIKEALRERDETLCRVIDEERTYTPSSVLPALNGQLSLVIHESEEYNPGYLELSQEIANDIGYADKYKLYKAMEAHGIKAAPVAATPASVDLLEDRETLLRGDVETLARRLDSKRGNTFGQTNYDLRKAGFPARGKANIASLEAMVAYLERGLDL
jgi:superfamily II DNA or RNA helicase